MKGRLAVKGEVTFVGQGHKFQIWEPGRFVRIWTRPETGCAPCEDSSAPDKRRRLHRRRRLLEHGTNVGSRRRRHPRRRRTGPA